MKPEFDLIVRGGRLVGPEGIRPADIGIAEGAFAKIGPDLSGGAAEEIDAAGAFVFPGVVDAHVHFNEPGRTEWEGLATGSLALAAGGGTCFFDMPLNSTPPVLDAGALRTKRALGEAKSRLDFALWGGLVPGNLPSLAGLAAEGAIGLKAFLCPSGLAEFPPVDRDCLREGMRRARDLGLIVAVHAEDPVLAGKLAEAAASLGRTAMRDYLASRPVEVETRAIRDALEVAAATGCPLHIVHVSSPEGIALVDGAKAAGVDVTAETCPHYLLCNEADAERLGAAGKCAPPFRDESRRLGLWSRLRAGSIDTLGSDHSPAPPEMKGSPDLFRVWGGVAGGQHGFELLLSETLATAGRDWPLLAALAAGNPAARFRLPGKGRIAEGADADFLIARPGGERRIGPEELLTRHRISPYLGRASRVRIVDTWVRGRPVLREGKPAGAGRPGRFLRPKNGRAPV